MNFKRFLRFSLVTALVLVPLIPSNTAGENVYAQQSETTVISENFDNVPNNSLPEGWKVVQGSAAVQDGQLLLTSPATASPARVLVPLNAGTGDYVFEADMTFVSAVEDTRWASMMYRIQNENFPYYQFALRRGSNALNGLEFAKRSPQNNWNVQETNFYHEKLEYNKSYRIKIIASKNRVQQFIDNKLYIDSDQANDWLTGDIGFQAAGTTVQFDNVKVTTYSDTLPPVQNSGAFIPAEPETNIINPPTIIDGAQSSPASTQTASAILPVSKDNQGNLKVRDKSLKEALLSLKNRQIPILKVEDEGVDELIIDAVNETQTRDFHLISSKPAIVKSMTKKYPTARGGLVYTKNSLNKHDLKQLVRDVHTSNGKSVVIPQKLLSKEIVHYLHNRTVSVWGEGAVSKDSSHEMIHLGVDGIISANPEYTIEALGEYPENTIIQRPIIAAHRGIPSLAPENTMAGYRLAYELGADMIETDIKKTKDGHLIVMHDDTVNRTTDGTGRVKDLTLQDIRKLDAGIKFSPEFAGEKVPTFKEFLQGFKGKDVVLLIELKDTGIEEQVIQEIRQENMMDQVVLQSFNLDSMVKINQLTPELPLGYLFSAAVPATEGLKIANARKMMDYGTVHNVTLNASYGTLYQEAITYMRQRGMISLHWTFRNEDPFRDKLKEGLIGPITDYTQWLSDSPVSLETPIKKRNLKVGKTAEIKAKAFLDYRTKKTENIDTELIIMEGSGVVRVNGNSIEALKPGVAYVFVKHTFTMLDEEWNLVSEPIQVNVSQ
ncbi:MAG: glycerophosphodiester phosphodiesterase family protein [Bacillus sp. (in: firmicutes)]